MITKQLIDQIEGEASVYFDMKDNVVDFATISFPHFRGIEAILKEKNALDALVITPRICGVCGHSHLMATVRAIEDAYKNAGFPIKLNEKINNIREFTLIMEIIQNHFKWIYLTIIPELVKLSKEKKILTPLKGAYASKIASKAIALFAGQWPHSSYMIPGGITSDPTDIDILKADSYLDELINFFEKEFAGNCLDTFLSYKSYKDFKIQDNDFSFLNQCLKKAKMDKKGFCYDRFLVIGEHSFTKASLLKHTRHYKVNPKFVSTIASYSPNEISYAKNAQYKKIYYETGSLARTISLNNTIIKNMHRKYKDSAYTRVMARVFELANLLIKAKNILKEINISQASFVKVSHISNVCAFGIGVVEAPRGPLIHKVKIDKGIIKEYNIITPTQFNIGSDTKSNLTPVQKAMNGLNKEDALFVFRTFDVCSVCTTH